MAAKTWRDGRVADSDAEGSFADTSQVVKTTSAEDRKDQSGADGDSMELRGTQYKYVTPPNTPPGATQRKCPGAPKRRRRVQRPVMIHQDSTRSGQLREEYDTDCGWETSLQPRNLFN